MPPASDLPGQGHALAAGFPRTSAPASYPPQIGPGPALLRKRTSHHILGQSPKFGANRISENEYRMDIDRIARQIIALLQRDGRCPNTVIARELGISESAVRSRIHALTSSGILQIIGLTDPGNMGFGVMALIGVQANNDLNRIADLVSTWPETTYVVISAGSFDLLIELVCTDNNDLLRVVERLRAVDGVRSTESFIYISRHKLNYAYAADRDDELLPSQAAAETSVT
jgi:Lrp/AsnC family transcriptional regulator, regulator for asnA, asnC and gidA